MVKRNSKELRKGLPPTEEEIKSIKRNPIYIVLDNVLDTYNIGAIFRLADAVAAEKILLCEGSETPPNHRIQKASVNTWQWVPWEYYASTSKAILNLQCQIPNIQVVALELSEKSVPYHKFDYSFPVAIVAGHETDGVKKEILEMCDGVVDLPMYGVNISLNVMVSLGILLYEVARHLPKKNNRLESF